MRDYERRNANRKTVLAAIDRKLPERPATSPQIRPVARRRARADDRLARLRRQRRRAPRRLRRVRRRRRARRPRARGRRQGQARLRRGARGRDPRARAGPGRAASPTTRARRGRCCPTSASSQIKAEQVRRRAAPDRPARRLRARADRPRRRAVALPQQARVLVRHGRRRRARVRLPRARPLGRDRPGRRLPARLRARQRGARAGARSGAARRACSAWDRRAQRGLPAQPRRARGPPHRRSCRCGWSPRPASSTSTRWPTPSTCDGLLWTQTDEPRREHGGRRDDAARRRAAAARASSAT